MEIKFKIELSHETIDYIIESLLSQTYLQQSRRSRAAKEGWETRRKHAKRA